MKLNSSYRRGNQVFVRFLYVTALIDFLFNDFWLKHVHMTFFCPNQGIPFSLSIRFNLFAAQKTNKSACCVLSSGTYYYAILV